MSSTTGFEQSLSKLSLGSNLTANGDSLTARDDWRFNPTVEEFKPQNPQARSSSSNTVPRQPPKNSDASAAEKPTVRESRGPSLGQRPLFDREENQDELESLIQSWLSTRRNGSSNVSHPYDRLIHLLLTHKSQREAELSRYRRTAKEAQRCPEVSYSVHEVNLTKGKRISGDKRSKFAERDKHIQSLSERIISHTQRELELEKRLQAIYGTADEFIQEYKRRLQAAYQTLQQVEDAHAAGVCPYGAAFGSSFKQKTSDEELGHLRKENDALKLQLSQIRTESMISSRAPFAPDPNIW